MTRPRLLALTASIVIAPSTFAQSPAPADATCPVTVNNGRGLTEPRKGGDHTNDGRTLATSLWPDGTIMFTPGGSGCVDPDGTLGMKWPWWRGVRGQLTLEGRRLDGPAAPMRASIPAGYGPTGFQSTGLMFPTAGCWEVTGRVGAESLTFVTRAVKVDAGPAAKCRDLNIYVRASSTR
jgi:hypothetical protein